MRKLIKIRYFFFLLLFLAACHTEKSKSKYPGFSETPSGLYYKRHTIGEGKSYPDENDFLELSLRFRTLSNEAIVLKIFKNENGNDTLHFHTAQFHFQFVEALSLLSEGDSCTFIVQTKSLFDTASLGGIFGPISGDSLLLMDAKLLHLKTPKQQEEERISYQKLCVELAADEQTLLQHFLDTSSLPFPKIPDENGVYYYMLKQGQGRTAKSGDMLTIRYKGKFLDGQIFDESTYQKEALNFKLGEQGQVIKGIEKLLYKLHEGDIANVLLPSSLAFGKKGSTGGIVGPFKTVTFALEILKIN